MYVFLDDLRYPDEVTIREDFPKIPDDEWVIVRNVYEFIDTVNANLRKIKHVAFDHDLADQHYMGTVDELTGYRAAQYLVECCMCEDVPLPGFSCHSMNPAGRSNIIGLLESFKRSGR